MKNIKYQYYKFYIRQFSKIANKEISFKDLISKYQTWFNKISTVNIFTINTAATASTIVAGTNTTSAKLSDKPDRLSGKKEKKKYLVCN